MEKKVIYSKPELKELLAKNVVFLTYTKKDGATRDMICTTSQLILRSFEGMVQLGYRIPTHKLKYNIDATDNIIIYDLQKRDFRTIAASRAVVDNFVDERSFYEQLVDGTIRVGEEGLETF